MYCTIWSAFSLRFMYTWIFLPIYAAGDIFSIANNEPIQLSRAVVHILNFGVRH